MNHRRIPVTGGCLCAAVRYESMDPPTEGFFCHCTICQKAYGGLFSATVKFAGSSFKFTQGELKHYRATPIATRGFCDNCGSPVAFFYDDLPDVWIKIGSLDHPDDWPMTRDASWGRTSHWCTDTKVPWYEITDGLPQRTGTV